MNKFLKKLFVFVLIIVFIMAFSSSYLSLSIDNLAYVLAIGIDKADGNNLQVSFQFSTTAPATESGSTEKTPSVLNSVTASSISTAINLMNGYMGKELNMSHCKIVIFSEEIASEGISDEVFTLINDTQVRPTSNIVVTKCNAKYYMEKTSPELENLISKYYEVFTNSSKYTGFIPDATIGDFFNALICQTCEPYAILGGLSTDDTSNDETFSNKESEYQIKANQAPIEGENGAENIGIAVFKGDMLAGELTALETIAFLTVREKVQRFLISVPDPISTGQYIDLYLTPKGSPKVDLNISTTSPYIKFQAEFTGRIYSMDDNSQYSDPKILEQISQSCNNYLETEFYNYLYKTSKELKSDVNRFGKYAVKQFFTTQDYEKYNWLDNYKNAFFDVSIKTSIKSGMLITET